MFGFQGSTESQYGQGNGEIIATALLFEVGRCQVDGNTAQMGILVATVLDGRPYPLSTLFDRRVGKPYNVILASPTK